LPVAHIHFPLESLLRPIFSYNENFMPQFRMSLQSYAAFEKQHPAVAQFLQTDPRLTFQKPAGGFVVAG